MPAPRGKWRTRLIVSRREGCTAHGVARQLRSGACRSVVRSREPVQKQTIRS
jgi:hypothetical protein